MPEKSRSLARKTMKQIQDSYKNLLSFPVFQPQSTTATTAIVPLQPPEEKNIDEWERLAAQAQRINQIVGELEVAMLEFKELASILNSQRRYLHSPRKPYQTVCQYFPVSVPWVGQKPDKSFVLTTRTVDLFRAEKEAALLAQQLRQQAKKQKLALQRNGKDKDGAETNRMRLFPKRLINKS